MKPSADIPVLIDKRVGSNDLYPLLQMRKVPVELTTLAFGDVAFATTSPEGKPVVIGIERKRIRDLIQSAQSGRLAGHQIPGMLEQYTYRWILVEGIFRTGDRGQLEVPAGKKQWRSLSMTGVGLDRYLLTLELRGGCGIRRTYSADDTAQFIEAIWGWWTQKSWGKHRSHLALHKAPDVALFSPPSLVQRMAAELPGIGYDKASAVAKVFPTPRAMLDAGADEWLTIPGIGKTLTTRILHQLSTAP